MIMKTKSFCFTIRNTFRDLIQIIDFKQFKQMFNFLFIKVLCPCIIHLTSHFPLLSQATKPEAIHF